MKKKFLFFAAVTFMATAAVMVSCNKDDDSAPANPTNLYPAGETGTNLYGYIDQNGNMVIKPTFTSAATFSGGYAQVRLNGNYRFINAQGNVQTTPSVTINSSFINGYAQISEQGQGLMDNKFNITIQPYYSKVGPMTADGLVSFKAGNTNDDKLAYVDANGNLKIQTQFPSGADFVNGLAVVRNEEGRYGAINTTGNLVIDDDYYELYSIGADRLAFRTIKKSTGEVSDYGILDKEGKEIVRNEYKAIDITLDNDLIPVEDDEYLWGFINKDGSKEIKCKYGAAYAFSEGYAWVYNSDNSRWELIDKEGKSAIRLKEDERPFSYYMVNGLVLVRSNGYYDKNDDWVYDYSYRNADGKEIYSWKSSSGDNNIQDYPAKAPAKKDAHVRPSKNFELK